MNETPVPEDTISHEGDRGRRGAGETLRCFARRLMEMEEEMRRELAVELHDEIGRDLTALGLNLAIIGDSLPGGGDGELRSMMEDSGRLIEAVSRNIRSIMARLRPPLLDDYGLVAALRWHADLFSRRTGVAASIVADDPFPRLPSAKELVLFRIVDEALANVARHAGAERVAVTVRRVGGTITLSVSDNGSGLVPPSATTATRGPGWGVMIMRERAEAVGGVLRLDSSPGKGTVVTAEIPEGR